MTLEKYKKPIEKEFAIIDKTGNSVPFVMNSVQERFIHEEGADRSVILKARQQGFSSLILAIFTTDFIFKDNSRSVIVADNSENATELLDRVRYFIQSFEDKNGFKLQLKYNSKYELFNESNNARYTIGTAENKDFGRSKTITNLHLSEFAFYPDPERLFAGVMQAVVPDGKVIIETTANGFNYLKKFWDECKAGERPFGALFYGANEFYSSEFLENKKKELGRLFTQEYPSTDIEAFLSSGDLYFNHEALARYLEEVKDVQTI